MARIADEIKAAQPHIVGLQEAAEWRTRTPTILAGPAAGPELVAFDFVQLLLNSLGPTYALAIRTNTIQTAKGFDEQAVGILGGVPSDIRLIDREAILVRTDLPSSIFKILGTGSATFAAFPSAPVGGGVATVEGLRNYAFVDVEMSGQKLRVASTHLEADLALFQIAQGNELIAALNASPYPQIALGDFNSKADGSGTPTYGNMLAAGFKDAWLEKGLGAGFTCCQAGDLLNDPSQLDQRVDFVFHRAGFRTLDADVVGEDPGDRTASGLWPSDHTGVLVTFELVPEPGSLALLGFGLAVLVIVLRRASRKHLVASIRVTSRRGP